MFLYFSLVTPLNNYIFQVLHVTGHIEMIISSKKVTLYCIFLLLQLIIIKYLHSSEVHVVGAVNELKGSEDYVDYKYQVSD